MDQKHIYPRAHEAGCVITLTNTFEKVYLDLPSRLQCRKIQLTQVQEVQTGYESADYMCAVFVRLGSKSFIVRVYLILFKTILTYH